MPSPTKSHLSGTLSSTSFTYSPQTSTFSPFSSKCSSRAIFPLVAELASKRSAQRQPSRLNFQVSETADVPYILMDMASSTLRPVKVRGKQVSAAKLMPTHTSQLPFVSNCQVSYHTSPPPPLPAEHFLMQSSPLLKMKLHHQLRPPPGQRLEWYTQVSARERLLQASLRQKSAALQNHRPRQQRRVRTSSRSGKRKGNDACFDGGLHSPVRAMSTRIWMPPNESRGSEFRQSHESMLSVESFARQMGATTPRDGVRYHRQVRRAHMQEQTEKAQAMTIPISSPLYTLSPTSQRARTPAERNPQLASGTLTTELPARAPAAHQVFPYKNASKPPAPSDQVRGAVLKTSSPRARKLQRERGQLELAASQSSLPSAGTSTIDSADSFWSRYNFQKRRFVSESRPLSSPDASMGSSSVLQGQGAATHVRRFMHMHGVTPDSPTAQSSSPNSPGWHSDDDTLRVRVHSGSRQ